MTAGRGGFVPFRPAPIVIVKEKSPSLLRLATRKSRLAMVQAEATAAHLRRKLPGVEVELVPMSTTGDRKRNWSLPEAGGKGLFTKELEIALDEGEADLAVHSAKDLPTEMGPGLALAGFLPRESAADVLVVKEGVARPAFIATGSPRRRSQLKRLYPQAVWKDIRGNVETRLRKVASGDADATMLALAGLKRLGILHWPGLVFRPLPVELVVPAAGQAAIAIQCRGRDRERYQGVFDRLTEEAVLFERALLRRLGGGCQVPTGVHWNGRSLHVYHENSGHSQFNLNLHDAGHLDERLDWVAEQVTHPRKSP